MIPSKLLAVTDRHAARRPLADTVRAVLDGGAGWVWFRDRDLEPGARRALAADILALVRAAGGRLTIGSDVELAAALGADGVHLGGETFGGAIEASPVVASGAKQSGESPRSTTEAGLLRSARDDGEHAGHAVASARSRLGPNALVGLSTHKLADVETAAEAGADYVTLSPIFPTASKPGYGPALGLDALRAASGIPVVALGGIGLAQARACREAGAAGVAVMGGLMRADDPAAATRALLDALG